MTAKTSATKTTTTKRTSKRPAANGPSTEEIALRAFELFMARGGQHGRHEEDWHRAEKELRERHQPS
jgi:hypothetical protein